MKEASLLAILILLLFIALERSIRDALSLHGLLMVYFFDVTPKTLAHYCFHCENAEHCAERHIVPSVSVSFSK